MSSGFWNSEALGDNADPRVTPTETTGWWHYDHVVTLRMRYCQIASDYCCWNICVSSRSARLLTIQPRETCRWVKIPSCAHSWEHHCPSEVFLHSNKELLLPPKARRFSVAHAGCACLLCSIPTSAWPVTSVLSRSLGYWQQDNTDQPSKFGPTSSPPELLDKKNPQKKQKVLVLTKLRSPGQS